MTVYQNKQVLEPRLYQNKRQNNRKTVPDDDMDSIPKPKTRQKKESTVRKNCKSHMSITIKIHYMQTSKESETLTYF